MAESCAIPAAGNRHTSITANAIMMRYCSVCIFTIYNENHSFCQIALIKINDFLIIF